MLLSFAGVSGRRIWLIIWAFGSSWRAAIAAGPGLGPLFSLSCCLVGWNPLVCASACFHIYPLKPGFWEVPSIPRERDSSGRGQWPGGWRLDIPQAHLRSWQHWPSAPRLLWPLCLFPVPLSSRASAVQCLASAGTEFPITGGIQAVSGPRL